ncbi:MAG: alpha/beta hydrolase [Pseudomonadales bacterium]
MRSIFVLFVLILTVACSSSGEPVSIDASESVPALELTLIDPPLNLPADLARFAVNVPYDQGDERVFDIFLPDSDTATPLIIYFHAGGFTQGNKEEIYLLSSSLIATMLENGIAFASANYRLLGGNEEEGVIGPLRDGQRALQYIRYQAENLNIDPNNIALMGTSAGAGMSLWIAMADDRSDASNNDPILRQSTRVNAVATLETQASYDLSRWETDVFPSFGITLAAMTQDENLLSRILQFYAISDADQMFTEAGEQYRREVDMLAMLSADDPEFFVRNIFFPQNPELDDIGALFHHPSHAQALVSQANAAGVSVVADLPTIPSIGSSDEGLTAFLLRHLNAN